MVSQCSFHLVVRWRQKEVPAGVIGDIIDVRESVHLDSTAQHVDQRHAHEAHGEHEARWARSSDRWGRSHTVDINYYAAL